MTPPNEGEPTREQLARDVLALADVGGMPDSYWTTDSRVTRARAVLSVEEDERYTRSDEWLYGGEDESA